MRSQATLQQVVGQLTIQAGVLKLALLTWIAEGLHASGDPDAGLRQFADQLHKRIDEGQQPPAAIQGMMEATRTEIDQFMRAVQVALDERD